MGDASMLGDFANTPIAGCPQCASVTFVAHDMTMAWTIEFHLGKYVPGSPAYQKVLALKQMAEQRGAVFPAKSPKQRRGERRAASSP